MTPGMERRQIELNVQAGYQSLQWWVNNRAPRLVCVACGLLIELCTDNGLIKLCVWRVPSLWCLSSSYQVCHRKSGAYISQNKKLNNNHDKHVWTKCKAFFRMRLVATHAAPWNKQWWYPITNLSALCMALVSNGASGGHLLYKFPSLLLMVMVTICAINSCSTAILVHWFVSMARNIALQHDIVCS